MKVPFVLLIVVVLSGCARLSSGNGSPAPTGPLPSAAATADSAPAQSNATRFASLLQSSVLFDYTIPESPMQLRDESDLVVVGRFVDVIPGRAEGRGLFATFTIEVEEVLAGAGDLVTAGAVHLELRANGESKIEEYAADLPTGRVLVFLADQSAVVGSESTGAPAGAPIFALQSPIGLIIEDADAIVAGYEDLSQMPPAWSEHQTFDGFAGALSPDATSG